ncbi:hypothetical protein ACH42_15780 [Endozoicomonas sp. (ex Bugula neritina AB1)]|nr:hypothetical protein ACH42_15780 [Endozoicomonas sp. (ex Bugula neritina AB1)]
MADSVGSRSDIPSVPMMDAQMVPAPILGADDGVSLGYSDEDSASYAKTEKSAGAALDSDVELDAPEALPVDSRDFQQKAFDARLNGFRSIVADFNAKFNKGDVDLSDTHTLLMVVKGIINDTRALVNANTIDNDRTNRVALQAKRQKAVKELPGLKSDVIEKQGLIDGKVQQKSDKSSELAEKMANKELMENDLTDALHPESSEMAALMANREQIEDDLADAYSTDDYDLISSLQEELYQVDQQAMALADEVLDSDLILSLQEDLAYINQEIFMLDQEVSDLTYQVNELQAQRSASQGKIDSAQKLLAFTVDLISEVKPVLNTITERYDAVALDTGEEEVQKSKRKNRDADAEVNREGMRHSSIKRDMKSRAKDEIKVEMRNAESGSESSLPQRAPISQEQLERFAALLPVPITLENVRNGSVPPNPEQVSEFVEALALIVQAEPPVNYFEKPLKESSLMEQKKGDSLAERSASTLKEQPPIDQSVVATKKQPFAKETVTASEEQPVNQSHLGDNRSLEGANNPQAFSLILLENNMNQLRENILATDQLQSVEEAEGVKIAELVDELHRVEGLVIDALEDVKAAETIIHRSRV